MDTHTKTLICYLSLLISNLMRILVLVTALLITCIDGAQFFNVGNVGSNFSKCVVNCVQWANRSEASNFGYYTDEFHKSKFDNILRDPDFVKMSADEERTVQQELTDIGTSVNKTVTENQEEFKRKKQIILPKTEDISTLSLYLTTEAKKCYEELKTNFTRDIWTKLASCLLMSLQIFNRRRPGEIERVFLEDFLNFQCVNEVDDKDILDNLSQEGQDAAKCYVRFETRGKLGRRVPVLVHRDHLKHLELIINQRSKAGVSRKNPYLFGLPGNDDSSHLQACALMRKFADACGAKNPVSLRATTLRKHIATKSSTMNLNESDISDLANFMGHAEKIHREHYKLPIATREIAVMSQLLEKAQGPIQGQLGQDKRKRTDAKMKECFVKLCRIQIGNKNLPEECSNTKLADEKQILQQYSHFEDLEQASTPLGMKTPEKISYSQSNRDCPGTSYVLSEDDDDSVKDKNFQYESEDDSDTDYATKKVTRIYEAKRNTISKKTWNTPEKHAARKLLQNSLNNTKLPSLIECINCIKENPVLQGRTPQQLKAWINNNMRKSEESLQQSGRCTWITPERHAIKSFFKAHIEERKLPTFAECRSAQQQHPVLKGRNLATIKTHISNEIRRRKLRFD